MIRCLFAAVALTVVVGLVTAEEFMVTVKKVEGGKLVGLKRAGKDKKGEEVTLETVADVKVVTAKFDFKSKKAQVGEALEGGLKNKRFTEIGDKGVFCQVVTNDDGKVTEVRVFTFGGKKKKDS